MVENFLIGKFLTDIIPTASSASGEADLIKNFTGTVKEFFGIDSARVDTVYGSESKGSAIVEYLTNTRKAYIDNQLSKYSEFPELVAYRNQGFLSGAFLPIMAHGKVIAVLEMLSNQESKFSGDLVDSIAFGAAFLGFSLAYKVEADRNVRLAGYFDSAFGSGIPQFLVSSSNSIVKANKAAMKAFPSLASNPSIAGAIGMDFTRLAQLSGGRSVTTEVSQGMVVRVSASKVSDSIIHVVAEDITYASRFMELADAIGQGSDVAVLFLDDNLAVREIFGSLGAQFADSKNALLGKSISDLLGISIADTNHGSQRPALQKAGSADMALPNGNRIMVHYALHSTPLSSLIVVANADLEKYVAGLKHGLDDFVNTTSDVVIVTDEQGYITDCNMPVEHALGYAKEELVGKNIRDLYTDTAELDKDLAYVRSGGNIDNTYVNVLKENGEVIPATHSIRQLRSGPEPSYMFLVKELWTKNLMADQAKGIRERDTQIKNLKQASDLKSQFIYNISHELKTPLTNIKGFAKLMYEGDFGELNAEQKEYVKTILDESDRLMLIITQVLDAAKLDAQKVKLEVREMNMRDIYENPSIKALEETAHNKGLSFSWNVGYDVPNIMADPNRLIQVFVNLIGNSIKFTEKGGITVQISRKSRKTIQCKVADTGIGISDEDKKKIFRKFYQAQKKNLVRPDGTGTGLGLSITRDIVSLHGGKITFESQLGRGTTFTVLLPVAKTERRKSKQQAPQPK